jgi:hypothetical protein
MGPRRARAALIALVVPALVAIFATGAIADPTKTGSTVPRNRPGARVASPKKGSSAADAGASTPASGALAAPTQAVVPSTTGASSIDAGVVEAKTLDGGTHVFKFSELDIEGRLKSPQLVYFLRRVRAEFAAGDLGHRSFMREMSETRKESSF